MQTVALEKMTKKVERLTSFEQIELLEILVSQLKRSELAGERKLDWQELYGLGKGLWFDEDAQDYVNHLREERI